jgi:hypothetical protein
MRAFTHDADGAEVTTYFYPILFLHTMIFRKLSQLNNMNLENSIKIKDNLNNS